MQLLHLQLTLKIAAVDPIVLVAQLQVQLLADAAVVATTAVVVIVLAAAVANAIVVQLQVQLPAAAGVVATHRPGPRTSSNFPIPYYYPGPPNKYGGGGRLLHVAPT